MYKISKVRDLCRERGTKLRTVAKAIGVTEHGLQKMITRETASVPNIKALSDYFNVPIEYWLENYKEPLDGEEQKNVPIGTRLNDFIHFNGLTQVEFAKILGVPATRINNIVKNSPDFNVDLLAGITQHYPNLNLRWLLLGAGNMTLTEAQKKGQLECTECKKKDQVIYNLSQDNKELKDQVKGITTKVKR
jgi:plasmid maintenance system antidote protein VapI